MEFGIVLDARFLQHETPRGHPERPERLRALLDALGNWEKRNRLRSIEPRLAETERLSRVHSQDHVRRIAATAERPYSSLDPDTHAGQRSYETARLAAGGAMALVEALSSGKIDSGILLARPPGHHAESDRAMGFCLFNTIAVAAQFALDEGWARRIAVVDFDVHHGNGTQEIFYNRPDVLFLSSHQYPFYPGTGSFREKGDGNGLGTTVNLPISAGAGDGFFAPLYQEFVAPILKQFQPDLILVSAGFDAHRQDPLGGMNLSAQGFGKIAFLLNEAAADVCKGRILYLLEGGYDLQGLVSSTLEVISACLDPSHAATRSFEEEEPYAAYRDLAKSHLKEFWSV